MAGNSSKINNTHYTLFPSNSKNTNTDTPATWYSLKKTKVKEESSVESENETHKKIRISSLFVRSLTSNMSIQWVKRRK